MCFFFPINTFHSIPIFVFLYIGNSLGLHAVIVGAQFIILVLAKDRTGTAFNCGFIQMLISITASWVYVIALYSAGASVNKTYDQQLYVFIFLFFWKCFLSSWSINPVLYAQVCTGSAGSAVTAL